MALHPNQYPFKTLIFKQLLTAVVLSLAISLPITLIPSIFIINHSVKSDIKVLESQSYHAIEKHLSTGWVEPNIHKVYNELRANLPSAALFLQKAPNFISAEDNRIQPGGEVNQNFIRLIKQVELQETRLIETHYLASQVYAAIPIVFKQDCLSCHSDGVRNGTVYEGALAGTLVAEMPLSMNHLTASMVLVFALIFLVIFVFTTLWITSNKLELKILVPLEKLSLRLQKINFNEKNAAQQWQRTPQEIAEIDELDEQLSEHIQTLSNIYEQLDLLLVSDQQSGLYHKDRFNEVLRYEMYRTQRYQRPFSIMLIEISNIKTVNSAAKNMEMQQPGSKYMFFGRALNYETRDTDMAFHLEQDMFALMAPETNQTGIEKVEKIIRQRIINTNFEIEEDLNTVHPQYEMTMRQGTVTYNGEKISPRDLVKLALHALAENKPLLCRYPNLQNNPGLSSMILENDDEDQPES